MKKIQEKGITLIALSIAVIIILTIGIANIFSSDSKLFKKISKHERIKGNQTLVNFISKIAKAIIYIIGAILVIADLGYDLGGIIAGLGFTGVIVALAAQDIAENLFGGLAIILDKPFVVGDWIETCKSEGKYCHQLTERGRPDMTYKENRKNPMGQSRWLLIAAAVILLLVFGSFGLFFAGGIQSRWELTFWPIPVQSTC